MAPGIDSTDAVPAGRGASRKAHEVVADQLRQQIVSGALAAGRRLPSEEDLTVQFGVARTTLREALRVLESQGLIAIKRGRGGGPIVTHPDVEPIAMALAVTLQIQGTTIGDLDTARQLIEPEIARRLSADHTDADIARLDEAIAIAAEAADHKDGLAFGLAAANLHETLVALSGNSTLTTLSLLLQKMVLAYYTERMDTVDPALMHRAVRSYRKLVDLIRAGDGDGAATHWRATMLYTIGARDPNELVTIASS